MRVQASDRDGYGPVDRNAAIQNDEICARTPQTPDNLPQVKRVQQIERGAN
jgi:hypothetical protein